MKPLVIYHAGCWDGFCAAWVARSVLKDAEFVPMHYGIPAPGVTGRDVFLLDFSFKRADMERLIEQASRLTVLDHHKSAREELSGLEDRERTRIVFDMNKSGGRLAWEWFVPQVQEGHCPWLVAYTEDRDLWRHALPGSQAINAALRSYPLDFDLWDSFYREDSDVAMVRFNAEGEAIRRAERQIVETHVRNAHTQTIDGYAVKVVNATVLFSEIAGELAKAAPFGACYFDRQDGKRQWSLRSRDGGIDVSAIAKAHGGGGHEHAAGYEEAPHV